MTKKLLLQAEKREGRVDGKHIAGVLYGSDIENKKVKVKKIEFEKIYKEAGESTLLDFVLNGGESAKILIKEIQKDPVKDNIIHVDFYKVNMDKEITTSIPLNFVGESKAVKELGVMLNKNVDNVEVICLPSDLVNHIDVDLSAIVNLDDVIRIKDIKIPQGIRIQGEVGTVVASVSEKKEEEQPLEETGEKTEVKTEEVKTEEVKE